MEKTELIQFKKRKIITFILISYAISWIIWLPNVISHYFQVSWIHSNWLHFFGGFGPFFGAIFTTLIYDKRRGIKKYFLTRFIKGLKIKWIMVGLLMPIFIFFVAYIIIGTFFGAWTNLSLIGINSKIPINNIFLIWLLWCLFYGIGEESGWRGFFLPELTKKYNTRTATLYTAFVWAFWHMPLFFYDKDFMAMGLVGLIGWAVGLIFGSLLLGWLTKQSRWNLWPCIFWHATFNLFATSDKISPLYPAIMTMMIVIAGLWIARKYGDDLLLVIQPD